MSYEDGQIADLQYDLEKLTRERDVLLDALSAMRFRAGPLNVLWRCECGFAWRLTPEEAKAIPAVTPACPKCALRDATAALDRLREATP